MRKHLWHFIAASSLLLLCAPALADGPKDNVPTDVRPVPPVGMEVAAEEAAILYEALSELDEAITGLRKSTEVKTQALLPDVEIFARAVRQGLQYRELFSAQDVKSAHALLAEGHQRAAALKSGSAPWTTQRGLVVRGFRSRIDNTVQPFGLVIPATYTFEGGNRFRLDIWLHGRGESSTETVFINERMTKVSSIAPADTIVLHPYGRYSNAFKFAGEIDVLEALEQVKKTYRIDENRVSIRGFSMGGAGCWQFAVHYPDLFFAANPGAGFSETPEFLKHFQQETLTPTSYEKQLWQMYDCPGYANNLFQLPTIAYSGELDIQKQAADIMEQALAKQDLRLLHLIGPETKHSIHPESLRLMEEKLASLAELGRAKLPRELRFETYTLKYNRLHWLTITALGEHWQPATVNGQIQAEKNSISLQVRNVSGLRLAIPAGNSPFAPNLPVQIVLSHHAPTASASDQVETQTIIALRPASDYSWECDLHFDGKQWQLGSAKENGLRKQHNLQGPIDDAFMDSFIIVHPTGDARHKLVGDWSTGELEHLVKEWRRQFRGDAVVKRDVDITPADIASSNLILFGDPASNKVLASLLDKLPITWTAEQLTLGQQKVDSATHAPVLIYPNPANPQRYIVLNSGFTYREYAYLNNARQVPKLPDWAVIDLQTPPDTLWPGKVVEANFFDERWQLK